jgi:hypothetical protein
MPKVMLLGNLPLAGAYQPPPGRVVHSRHAPPSPPPELRGVLGSLGRLPYDYPYQVPFGLSSSVSNIPYNLGRSPIQQRAATLRGVAEDKAAALAAAANVRDLCKAACAMGYAAPAQATDKARCEAGCDAAFAASAAIINSTMIPPPADATPEEQASLQAERDALMASLLAQQQAAQSTQKTDYTPYIIGGLALVGVVGLIVVLK